LTYVLNKERNERDLDNMTKALVDAFARAVKVDDRNIHHLDALKIIANSAEEYVYIRVAPSYLQDVSTVMVPTFKASWAGQEPLILNDFIRRERNG
jgi:Endodeoxyribonuclease RusA